MSEEKNTARGNAGMAMKFTDRETMWLFEFNQARDFADTKEEFADWMDTWLNERLKEFDAGV